MPGGRAVEFIVAIERLIARVGRIGPVAAVFVLIFIVGFGVYALQGLSRISAPSISRSPVPGKPTAIEQSGEVLQQRWSAQIGTIQDIALIRPDRQGPVQLLALVLNTVTRFDLQGRALGRITLPHNTARLIADARGHLRFFLAASTESYWSWKDIRRVVTAYYLTAFDLDGRILWTYTLPADRASSPFDVLLVDGERDVEILVDTGARIVGLDTSGRERWSMPDQFRSWTQVDLDGSGRLGVMVLRTRGRDLEIAMLDAERSLTSVTALEGPSFFSGWCVQRMPGQPDAMIATLAMSSTPDANGKMRERFDVFSRTGARVGHGSLPWPTRPIMVRPIATVDTDGDGTRAWIVGGDDGALHLFSADARGQEAHHVSAHIRRFSVVPMSGGGDWIVLGTERGLEVRARNLQFGSAVD